MASLYSVDLYHFLLLYILDMKNVYIISVINLLSHFVQSLPMFVMMCAQQKFLVLL